ncbi:MAG: hypothetical protein QG552_3540 [Thermodesulfobacteriota bacterium]|nr:hypothetical protein [Thermodesulfobacteriota bacterium]
MTPGPSPLHDRNVDAPPGPKIRLVDVVKDRLCLSRKKIPGVDLWKPPVQNLFGGPPRLGTRLLPFPPVQHQLFPFELVEKLPCRLFDQAFLFARELRFRLGQQVKEGQFLF